MSAQSPRPLPHRFRQPALLKQALTHTSYANEHRQQSMPSNERMEFLGDSILSVVISEALYRRFADWNEGQLSRLRSRLVSERSLAQAARKLGLPQHVLLGRGERFRRWCPARLDTRGYARSLPGGCLFGYPP